MISVPSRRQPSNGNRVSLILALCFCGFLTVSCGLFKKSAKDKTSEIPEKEMRDMDRVYNPATGKYEDIADARSLIDTVDWRPKRNAPRPFGKAPDEIAYEPGSQIALLLPFDARMHQVIDEVPDARTRRFIHFWAGARLAARKLTGEGNVIHLHAFDTEGDESRIDQLINSRQLRDQHLIIGPYSRDFIQEVATFGDKNGIPVISPWHPSTKSLAGHPWLVQVTPGFQAHIDAIVEYVSMNYPDSQVYLVGRDNSSERNRVLLLEESFRKFAENKEVQNQASPVKWTITDSSPTLSSTSLSGRLNEEKETVFILPHYASDEEDFVFSFLRKLHAEKGENKVAVFGLPQWTNYSKLSGDFLENNNVHISANQFVDLTDSLSRKFQQEFFEEFGTIPENSAFQGYDVVYYFGGLLAEYGNTMLQVIATEPDELYSYRFNVQPYNSGDATLDTGGMLEYFENQSVWILQFRNRAFRKAK